MYNELEVNNELNHLKSFLNISEPYCEDVALIITAFKKVIVNKYDLNMDDFYRKLSKLKDIREIGPNPDFMGFFNPNIDNGTAYEISIFKDTKDDDFSRRYILTHELVHLFSSSLNSENLILNNINFSSLRNINEVLTEKFTSLIVKELFDDYDSRIEGIKYHDEYTNTNISTNPVGIGYENISSVSNALYVLFKEELITEFFNGEGNLVKSNKPTFESLEKALGLISKDMNMANTLQVNKPILDLFKAKVFNEDMTPEVLINYLKKSQEIIESSYLIGNSKDSYLKQSFETIDTMIYCSFLNDNLLPLAESRDSSRSFEVDNFIILMNFLRDNKNVLDKIQDLGDIDYKCIYDDKNKRIINLQIKNENIEEYYDIKFIKHENNKIDGIKLNISREIYDSEVELKQIYKIKEPKLDFEQMISENNRRNHAFIQKNHDNENLKYIYTFLDESLDANYQKILSNTDKFNSLRDNKNRNMTFLLTSTSDYNMDIVIRFLKKTKIADLINEPDVYGKNTVDYLLENGDINRLNTILKRLDLDNNYNLLKDEKLLMKSSALGKSDTLSYLNKNEIGLDIKNSRGDNLFFIALENADSMSSMGLLKNYNYNNFVSRNNIDCVNDNGENLINFYCKTINFNPFTVEKILEKYDLDINSQDKKGNTALVNLISTYRNENFNNTLISMNSLLSRGANTEVENKNGCTALQLAVFSLCSERESVTNDYKIIETLVKHNADINKENEYVSPLYCACKTKNVEILKAFVKGGISVNEIINKPVFKENFVSDKRRELRTELKSIAREINNQNIKDTKVSEQDLSI